MFRRLAVTAASSPHEDEATLLAASRADLESLPAEILETVLLYSADLALPRASPRLGVKLSDRVTLLRLFIWAFHDTWDQWFGIPRRFAYYYFTREFSIRIDEFQGDPVLQVRINTCWSRRGEPELPSCRDEARLTRPPPPERHTRAPLGRHRLHPAGAAGMVTPLRPGPLLPAQRAGVAERGRSRARRRPRERLRQL